MVYQNSKGQEKAAYKKFSSTFAEKKNILYEDNKNNVVTCSDLQPELPVSKHEVSFVFFWDVGTERRQFYHQRIRVRINRMFSSCYEGQGNHGANKISTCVLKKESANSVNIDDL